MSAVLQQSGVSITRKRVDRIPGDATIRPLRDQIVVKPLAWQPSKILEVVYRGRTLRGEILAVGPGHYPTIHIHGTRDGKPFHIVRQSKVFQPTQVRVGHVVELGGLELRGYAFDELLWGDQVVVVCREADVTGVVGGDP